MMVGRAALELLERRLQQQKRQEIKLRRVQLFVGVMVMGAEGENRTPGRTNGRFYMCANRSKQVRAASIHHPLCNCGSRSIGL